MTGDFAAGRIKADGRNHAFTPAILADAIDGEKGISRRHADADGRPVRRERSSSRRDSISKPGVLTLGGISTGSAPEGRHRLAYMARQRKTSIFRPWRDSGYMIPYEALKRWA